MLARAIANLGDSRARAINSSYKKVVTQQRMHSLCRRLRLRFHAPKAEMICTRIDFAFAAGADDVARAILLVAKKRSAAMDAFLLVRLSRIKW